MEEDYKIFTEKAKKYIKNFFKKDDVNEALNKNEFSDEEIEKVCSKIFSENYKNKSKIINEDVVIDLELFQGLGVDKFHTIFSYIDNTKTKTGKYLLKKILANPIDDVLLLQQRQDIIKKLSVKPLNNKIEQCLTKIKDVEDDLLWLWRDLNEETKYLFDMVYFKSKYLKFLNTNELAMKIYNYYVIIFSPLYGIISPIMMFLAPFFMIKFYFKTNVSLQLYFNIFKTAMGGLNKVFKMDPTQTSNNFNLSWTSIISLLVWVIFYIHGLSSNINTAKNTNKITNIIHKKLNNISKLVKEGHSLHDLTINDINKSSVYVSADVKKHFTILWNKIYETEPKLLN